jgi:hypothetical protein
MKFPAVNTNKKDRLKRIVAGLAVLSLVFVGPKTSWGFLGLIPLIIGLSGRCPGYLFSGKSSCAVPEHKV